MQRPTTLPLLAATLLAAACATDELDLDEELTEPASACEQLGNVEIVDGMIISQGDIILGTEEQLDELCAPEDPNAEVPQGLGIDGQRWPSGVVHYTIDATLPQRERITAAIAEWESRTFIDFRPRTTQSSYVRFTNGNRCASSVGRQGGRQDIVLSTGKDPSEIVAMAIAGDDVVYTWYADRMVSAGTSSDLDGRRAQYAYSLPAGYTVDDIVGMAIAKSNDRVYTWYDNGRVSVGTTSDLDKYRAPYAYSLPSGYTVNDIVGLGINSSDRVYAWYDDGRVSSGTSSDLDRYSRPAAYSLTSGYRMADLRGLAISRGNWVYAWYRDNQVSAGTPYDFDNRRPAYEYSTPGHCGTGRVIHEIGHAVGLGHEHARCDRNNFVRIFLDNVLDGNEHNFDRQCSGYTDYGAYDFSSVMHYRSYSFTKNDSPTLLRRPIKGRPVSGIVDVALASNDWVYTWWDDGTVTAGHSNDLESRRSRAEFSLPSGYTIDDIVGIAIAKSSNRVYTWYDTGALTVGTITDLDAYEGPRAFSLPSGYIPRDIVAMAIARDDHVYTWFDNGRVSSGKSHDLDYYRAPYSYAVASGYSRSDLLGIGIAGSNDRVYAWYDNGRASAGTTSDLDRSLVPYRYGARGVLVPTTDTLSAGDVAAVETMY